MTWVSLITSSCNYQEKQQQNFEKSFEQKCDENYDSLSRKELLHILETNKDNLTDSMYGVYHHHIDQKPNTDTLIIDMNRVMDWPLGTMKKVPKNLAALLWYHYDKQLFIAYNPELDSLLSWVQKLESIPYSAVDNKSIKTPAIYPELKDFAKPSLQDFIQDKPQRVIDSLGNDQEAIFITRNNENKAVTLYYKNGYIQLAQYSSPGIGWTVREYDHRLKKKRKVNRNTPEWLLYTNYNKDLTRYYYQKDSMNNITDSIPYQDKDDRQNPLRVSWSFGNAPMPYAIPILNTPNQNGVFLHQWRSNGDKLSHGCWRQTGQIAMELFDRIDNRVVKVIIFNLYDKKQNSTTK